MFLKTGNITNITFSVINEGLERIYQHIIQSPSNHRHIEETAKLLQMTLELCESNREEYMNAPTKTPGEKKCFGCKRVTISQEGIMRV